MRILLALLLWLAGYAVAETDDLHFTADTPYYFEYFDPQQKPWQPGYGLNIEEVFKNYQYYEIRFEKGNREFQVIHFVRGRREEGERYRVMPGGTLEKLPK